MCVICAIWPIRNQFILTSMSPQVLKLLLVNNIFTVNPCSTGHIMFGRVILTPGSNNQYTAEYGLYHQITNFMSLVKHTLNTMWQLFKGNTYMGVCVYFICLPFVEKWCDDVYWCYTSFRGFTCCIVTDYFSFFVPGMWVWIPLCQWINTDRFGYDMEEYDTTKHKQCVYFLGYIANLGWFKRNKKIPISIMVIYLLNGHI